MFNLLRNFKCFINGKIRSCLSSINIYLLKTYIIKRVSKENGFIGKLGQIIGAKKDKPRFVIGCMNHIEKGLNLWFSDNNLPVKGLFKTGDFLFVGFDTYFGIYYDISIGNNVLIGAQSYITSCTHNYDKRDFIIQNQGFKGAPVKIGNDVWIGCKVVVLPGVTIGNGVVIGAGSVVTKNIPDYEVWGGVPARKIKSRL